MPNWSQGPYKQRLEMIRNRLHHIFNFEIIRWILANVMFLSYKYEPVRVQASRNWSLYLSEWEKRKKVCSGSLCKQNQKFPKTVDHGSILSRNRFGSKMRKLNKHDSFSTIGFGCWPWTASRTMEKQYFVKMSSSWSRSWSWSWCRWKRRMKKAYEKGARKRRTEKAYEKGVWKEAYETWKGGWFE